MAEKDITEKNLESYNDVFANIVNGLLFNGEQIIEEDELEAESEFSIYKADGKLHEQERDVAKYWKNGEIRIALFGFENQTSVDADYFAKRRKVPGYHGTKDTIRHVDEFFKLMKVLTNDNKFATVYNENISIEEGGVSMCDFLDTVEARGEAKGEIKGKAVVIQELLKTGKMNIEQIADMLKLSIEKVTELAEMNLAPVV